MLEARQELLTAHGDAVDEIVAAACEQVLELPAYHGLEADGRDAVREFTTWLLHVFLSCLADDRCLSPTETARLTAVGRTRSVQGIDVDGFTAAFDIVYDRSHAKLVDLAARMADPAASTALGHLTSALGRLSRAAVVAVARGFEDAPTPGGERARTANALLHAMTIGKVDRPLLTESAGALGFAHEDGLAIVIAVPVDHQSEDLPALLGPDTGHGLELLASAARERPVKHTVGIVATHGNGQALEAVLVPMAAEHIVIAADLSDEDDSGTVYTDIRPYLHLAQHLTDGGVLRADDLRMFAALGSRDLQVVARFVRGRLGTVLARDPDDAEVMLATIAAYLETGASNKLAGERLHIHAKSVAARLRTIKQRTTVKLDGGVNRMQTLVALQMLRANGSDLPPIGDPTWAPDRPRRHAGALHAAAAHTPPPTRTPPGTMNPRNGVPAG